MSFVYSTNSLLSLSRLPHHFWSLVNYDQDSRDNPGTSIISYIVAKTLSLETTILPPELIDNLHKVTEFNSQLDKVLDALRKRIKTITTVMTNYSQEDRYWQISINCSAVMDKIKTQMNETMIKFVSSEGNDFNTNNELILLKLELDKLKMILNDEGILFEWEDNK